MGKAQLKQAVARFDDKAICNMPAADGPAVIVVEAGFVSQAGR